MTLFSLLAALLLEQWHPLASRRALHAWANDYVNLFQHQFNAGEQQHGRIAWLTAMGLLGVSTVATYWLLTYLVNGLLGGLFCILVLYLTMGFRQFSHYYTDIQNALREDDLDRARGLLTEWRGLPCHELNGEEVARVTIEEALLASHRHVFGVIVWFVIGMVLGMGPAGAALYRLAQFLDQRWGSLDFSDHGDFGHFPRQMYEWMEWLPRRLTAITFAIVGDFEDSVYCWRTQALNWSDTGDGIVLASGAGALGVILGQPIPQGGIPLDRPEIGTGDPADPDLMRSAVGMVWRALVFWMILLLLLSLASLIG
jgi:adenosylcobinamide-phosphate synthase